MELTTLIEKAHSAAKAKGFWDKERNVGELLMLIISECGEALEAHRKGKRAKVDEFDAFAEKDFEEAIWSSAFAGTIKDTFEDELADIVIRIADLAGGCGWANLPLTNAKVPEGTELNIGRELFVVTYFVVGSFVDGHISGEKKLGDMVSAQKLGWAIDVIRMMAENQGIDLDRHIELKMKYNESRPKLHGKAY